MHHALLAITLLATLVTTSSASAQPQCQPHESRATVVFDATAVRWERCAQPSFDVALHVDKRIADGTLLPIDVDFEQLSMAMGQAEVSLAPESTTTPTLAQAWQADTRWHVCGRAVDGRCRSEAQQQTQRAPATALLHAAAYVGMSLLSPTLVSRLSDAAMR